MERFREKFNPSILFNNENPVTINSEKYHELEKVMFTLRMKEQVLASTIKDVIKEIDRSEGWKEKSVGMRCFIICAKR